jgi:hypothetical protein
MERSLMLARCTLDLDRAAARFARLTDEMPVYRDLSPRDCRPTRSLEMDKYGFFGNTEVNDRTRSLGLTRSCTGLPPSMYLACTPMR